MGHFRVSKTVLEEIGLVFGLIMVQVVYAGNSVLMSYLMNLGIAPLTLVTFTAFSTFIVLAPLSVFFERNRWPKKLTTKLAIQLVIISFAGVTVFQSLFLNGIELTSPAVATAMPNLAPGLIFIIAWLIRLEKVKLSCIYSKVKIVGTILCVIGALMMSLLHSATAGKGHGQPASPSVETVFGMQKIIGCLYLMAAVLVLSSNVVLQATTLGDFPAPISLCAITSIIGVVITILVQLLQERQFQPVWPLASLQDLVAYTLLGGTVSGASVSFNAWAMKKKGPVHVSMFNPVATVLSVILSAVTLRDTISFGSLVGMCIMFTGLYFFLWAKRKESAAVAFPGAVEDEEKSLLA
uniref:WAT1-related protein n=1 Tax=Kalanchoe fedtschenkoi TaxID=63787 RepID=A0A7N0ZYN3_KALFE